MKAIIEKLKNAKNTQTFEISKDTSKVKIYITYVDEELMVAKNTYDLLERR